MTTARNERIEFNLQKDLMGWMIERNKKQHRYTATGLN
jgi:hypothetical protein